MGTKNRDLREFRRLMESARDSIDEALGEFDDGDNPASRSCARELARAAREELKQALKFLYVHATHQGDYGT